MKISLERKKLVRGRCSLYLSFSLHGRRIREFLNIYLEPPSSPEERERNRLRLELAQRIRFQREQELTAERYGLEPMVPRRLGVYELYPLYEQFLEGYRAKDLHTAQAVLLHLKRFAGERSPLLGAVTKGFCRDFFEALRAQLHGATPVGYFTKFRRFLQQCVEEGYLLQNPAEGIRLQQGDSFTKQVLSLEEMAVLARTPCKQEEVKRAFLFACNTGLRWCDVSQLVYQQVDVPNRVVRLVQQKVAGRSRADVLHLALNGNAVYLLSLSSGAGEERIFRLPSFSYAQRVLRQWMVRAGIRKHITFHCARHSFITNLLVQGVDLKTASELAGHSTIRHTERYIHLVDSMKRQAVERFPVLPFVAPPEGEETSD
jgi:site-specific recombinase XerD